MKLFLNCYVCGEGYVTKCFDSKNHVVNEGSHTMDEQERALFIRSNARLLLANVLHKRFGFVRQIDTGKKDENGRKCMINIAFEGEKDEVDPLLCWASDEFCSFSKMVCRLVSYEGTEFVVDWSIYQEIRSISSKYTNKINTLKAVALVCAEPSLDYFLKHSGMDWDKKDIERQIDPTFLSVEVKHIQPSEIIENNKGGVLLEKVKDLNLFFYCPTPSMGWILRQIDTLDGSIKGELTSARNSMSEISVTLLDNFGCKMGLFRSGERQCFLVKDVKADKPDRYGQLKTVSFVAESIGNSLLIKQMAAFALLDYESFRKILLECVNVSASTVGYRIDVEKLHGLIELFIEKKQPVKNDARITEWKRIIQAEKKQYTYLVLLSSLDYLNNSSKLDIFKSEVCSIYRSSIFEEMSQPLLLETMNKIVDKDSLPDPKNKVADNVKSFISDASKNFSSVKSTSDNDIILFVKKEENDHESDRIGADLEDTPTSKYHGDSIQVESINLLDYPAFKITAGIFAVALLTGIALIAYHFICR